MTPTTVVLLQELERWNKLVECMKQSLLLLQKALVGEIGMSTELEELAQSLFVGGIPSVWRKLAPDTQKSLANWLVLFKSSSYLFSFLFFSFNFFSYIQNNDHFSLFFKIHFRQRHEQYSNWIKSEPIVMWLSGLHVPEAYFTALVQTACRKNKWPLDKTSLFTKVTHNTPTLKHKHNKPTLNSKPSLF
jgi:dynein heavy chain, axonemal